MLKDVFNKVVNQQLWERYVGFDIQLYYKSVGTVVYRFSVAVIVNIIHKVTTVMNVSLYTTTKHIRKEIQLIPISVNVSRITNTAVCVRVNLFVHCIFVFSL